MKFHWRSIASLAILVSVLANDGAADIVLNGGFENGTGNSADDWANLADPNGSSGRSNADPRSGAFSAFIDFDNTNSAAPGAYFVQQNLGANTINPLLDHELSFWAKVEQTVFDSHDVFAQIQWLDQDNSNGGGFKGQELQSLIALGVNTDYQRFTLTDLAVPDDADSFLLRFQLSAGAVQSANNFNSLFIDDVTLTAIPEPGFAGLLGLAGLGCFAARRRRR
ncbi:MAG: PEP-CTERM sorting domain-containing protein [Planctomycetota bacterium]